MGHDPLATAAALLQTYGVHDPVSAFVQILHNGAFLMWLPGTSQWVAAQTGGGRDGPGEAACFSLIQ